MFEPTVRNLVYCAAGAGACSAGVFGAAASAGGGFPAGAASTGGFTTGAAACGPVDSGATGTAAAAGAAGCSPGAAGCCSPTTVAGAAPDAGASVPGATAATGACGAAGSPGAGASPCGASAAGSERELGSGGSTEPALPLPGRMLAARNTDVAMKQIAVQVVTFVRMLSAPLAPKRVFEPPPNAAPMSAPFPCCRSTSSMRKKQMKIWRTVMIVSSTDLPLRLPPEPEGPARLQ